MLKNTSTRHSKGICIYFCHSLFMKHIWTNSFNMSFSLAWGMVVQMVVLSTSSRLPTPLFVLHTRVLKKCEKKLAGSFNFKFRYLDDVLWLNCFNFVISHLSNRTWNKGYYSYIYTCFIHLPARRNWQWWELKSDTLRQKRKFQFSTFHLYVATFQQHLHMEYIYISVDAHECRKGHNGQPSHDGDRTT
jgi:hypothetical protein